MTEAAKLTDPDVHARPLQTGNPRIRALGSVCYKKVGTGSCALVEFAGAEP